MLDLTRWRRELLHDITRLDWPRLDLLTGLRAEAFVIAPLAVGAATGHMLEGLFATLAANFLTNTEGNPPSATPTRILAAACILEPSALALGTSGRQDGSYPARRSGVFLMLRHDLSVVGARGYDLAIFFVVGSVLPGDSVAGAIERFESSVLGDFWALLGVAIQRWLLSHRSRDSATGPPPGRPTAQGCRSSSPVHVRLLDPLRGLP